jgi:hypothetical protein
MRRKVKSKRKVKSGALSYGGAVHAQFGPRRLMSSALGSAKQVVQAITRSVLRGARLGPGVLGNTATVNIIGLLVLLGLIVALREQVIAAALAGVVVVGYLIYSSERAYRYAQRDPISALLGGTELYQLVRDQMSAKNKDIVSDETPVIGGSKSAEGGEPPMNRLVHVGLAFPGVPKMRDLA